MYTWEYIYINKSNSKIIFWITNNIHWAVLSLIMIDWYKKHTLGKLGNKS